MNLPHMLRETAWAVAISLPFMLLCDYACYRVAMRRRVTDLMEAFLIYIGLAPVSAAGAVVAAYLLRQPDAGVYAAIGVTSGGLSGAKRALAANAKKDT